MFDSEADDGIITEEIRLARKVFLRRWDIASDRQAAVIDHIGDHAKYIDGLPHHPYGHFSDLPAACRVKADELYRKLTDHAWFVDGAAWQEVEVQASHLYRVTTMASLGQSVRQNHLLPYNESELVFPFHKIGKDIGQDFEGLRKQMGGGWRPLQDLVHGTVRNERATTFWTSEVIEPKDVFAACLRSGMYTEMIYPIIMRIEVEWLVNKDPNILKAQRFPPRQPYSGPLLPVELDAFHYPVFDAQPLGSETTSGITIDLTRYPGRLEPGHPEYVIRNAPSNFIEFYVCEETRDPREIPSEENDHRMHIYRRTEEFWRSLLEYHGEGSEEL